MSERVFYQDFLFNNLPVDEEDYPKVEVLYVKEYQGKDCKISFEQLLKMDHKEDWDKLCHEISGKSVEIMDDVHLDNSEMEYYKKFYLATYFYSISKYSSSCVVVTEKKLSYTQMSLNDYEQLSK